MATRTPQPTCPAPETGTVAPAPDSPEPSTVAGAALGTAAVRGVAWAGLEKWGTQLVSLAVFVVLGRLLDPVAFGLVAAASVIVWFLRMLVDQGFAGALVQRRTLTPEHIDTAFWTAIGTGVFFAAATAAAAPLAALVFSQPRLTNVVRVLSVVFVLAALDSTQNALVERNMAFRIQAIRRLTATAASAGVAIGLAAVGAGVWALVAQSLVLEAVTVALLWTLVSWRPRRRFSARCFRELVGFGGSYTGIRILSFLQQNADNFLIGVILGATALGYYVVGYRVLLVMDILIVATISRVALSTFSKLQRDRQRLHAALYKAVGLNAAIALPLYAGMALVAGRLIPLLFGTKWAPSVPVMQVLAVAGVVLGGVTLTRTLVVSIGRVHNELRWVAALTAIQVATFVVTAPFGIVPVAIGVSAVSLLAWPVRLRSIMGWSGISLRAYFGRYVGPAAATAVMAAAMAAVGIVALTGRGVVPLLAEILTGAVIYPLALRLVAPSVVSELLATLRLLKHTR